MKARRLSPMDAVFLYMETRETPMHVAGLMIFSLPKGAPADFCRQLVAELRAGREFHKPWNLRLQSPKLKSLGHAWVEDHDLDLEYHVRHSALPAPGGERELGQLVARLHSNPIDFNRPPWEFHLVEGLENGRFAIYIKLHHALIDGVSGTRLIHRCLVTDAGDLEQPLFWAMPRAQKESSGESAYGVEAASGPFEQLRSQVQSLPDVARAFRRLFKAAVSKADPLLVPFQAPSSRLNDRVKGQRRFATQQYTVDRFKKLAKAGDCSLNDIVLAVCGGALRRFLLEQGELPSKSLTTGIPVSVRPKDDDSGGNAISMMIATLGTDIADPRQRLQQIAASTRDAKAHLQSLPKSAIQQYTVLFLAPYTAQMLTGIGAHARPIFNVIISNVPGPTEPLYLRGARLESTYPVSVPSHGQALNITCHSYAGTLNFGFTGCRDTLPHMQHIAVYCGEALEELEAELLQPVRRRKAA
ncbi:MAG TPA: wax ester/triacylglycerol synthase family O-acyltransferase [Solimonas sp.]|nr:wax ester/triacylglycerol synthase family O-acyltransferase [Solimonas sp.]